MDKFLNFLESTGFYMMFADFTAGGWKCLVMLVIGCVLLYLAIAKKYEPLLLLPIAFGIILTNLIGAEMYHSVIYSSDPIYMWDEAKQAFELFVPSSATHVNWSMFGNGVPVLQDLAGQAVKVIENGVPVEVASYSGTYLFKTIREVTVTGANGAQQVIMQGVTAVPGLLDYLYLGVKLGIYPCLIFFGVGAMTDFAPLIANPKSLLLGGAAQLGIFVTFVGVSLIGQIPGTGFGDNLSEVLRSAGAIGIIGGADGPTAIFVASMLSPDMLGAIAIAAYSYMALVPVIQPPIMRALTTEKERKIRMEQLRTVSHRELVLFPIIVSVFVILLVPSAGPLIGSLMLGNLFRVSGVTERLSKTVQNELCNIVTIFLGITVGATATGENFLKLRTLIILVMGVLAFAFGTAGGVLLAKFMNLFLKKKINPLIGSAGVSAVPMAARVSQVEGQKADPGNFLLMHAMGPNVAGVIGSAIAAGVLIATLG